MNKMSFLYKFYINKQRRGHIKWNLFFPFVGVILGCVTVALTLAIMEGMEYEIFNKLKNISFPAKLTKISNDSNKAVKNYLIENKIEYIKGLEDQVLIINHDEFRLITIHGIDDFKAFKKKVFDNNLQEININSHLPEIYLGKSLASKLNIALGDTVDIAASKQINIFTGLPPQISMIVGGIYELMVLDYDQKHIFTNYSSLEDFLPDNRLLYYLNEELEKKFSKTITQNFPGLGVHTWENEHHTFITAMKLEKVAYSIIGFLIVGIAGFTLMSMMSLAVMQKVPQIGILRAIGAKKMNISAIFIFQALITWLIGSITGISLALVTIKMDKHYQLIQIIFPDSVFFQFSLILQNGHILLIMIVSLILLLSAAIYPSIKAAHLDIVKSIAFR